MHAALAVVLKRRAEERIAFGIGIMKCQGPYAVHTKHQWNVPRILWELLFTPDATIASDCQHVLCKLRSGERIPCEIAIQMGWYSSSSLFVKTLGLRDPHYYRCRMLLFLLLVFVFVFILHYEKNL